MAQYIDKSALVAEIEKLKKRFMKQDDEFSDGYHYALKLLLSFLNTLEVKYPYEQCVQYDSIKAGIQAHAETYSFNIESELFNQLTKEQQPLWRKEIEQAVISGGEVGVELSNDVRYKENLGVKDVDLEKEFDKCCENYIFDDECEVYTARHFFELGLKAAQINN